MPRSEYFGPNLLPGEREEPSIILDAERILGLLLRAEMMMTKVDRIRYATRAITEIEDVIREFSLAYDFEDDRRYHLKRMMGHVAVFLRLFRIIGDTNAIRVKPEHESMTPDQMKLALQNSVAALDEGTTRWKRSLDRAVKQTGKGKTGGNGRDRQSPDE